MPHPSTERVIEGLRHSDWLVRSACLDRLSLSWCDDTAASAAAVDSLRQYGSDAFRNYTELSRLRHDRASLASLVQWLQELEPPAEPIEGARRYHFALWLLNSPLPALVAEESALQALSHPDLLGDDGAACFDLVRYRSEWSEAGPAELRKELESLIEDCLGGEEFPHEETRLIKELAPFLAATGAVTEAELESWTDLQPDIEVLDGEAEFRLATGLLLCTELNRVPPVEHLIHWLGFEWDFLNDLTTELFVRHGREEDIRALLDRYPGLGEYASIEATPVIAGTWFPWMNKQLAALLSRGLHPFVATSFAERLALSGDPEALKAAADHLAGDPGDPERFVLRHYLFAAATMAGRDDSETREWRRFVQEDYDEIEKAARKVAEFGPEEPGDYLPFYDPERPLHPDEWNALAASDREMIVLDYVEECEPGLPSPTLHAMIHSVVENQIAMGDDTPAAATVDRLMNEGLSRHEAIHAIGAIVGGEMFEIIKHGKPHDEDAYFENLAELTAARWLAGEYGTAEDADSSVDPVSSFTGYAPPAQPYQREAPKIGRNDPCPCGSGKKFKNCCIRFAN